MVRAVVSARQASLERSGSAPAPCPQAEPRPDAEKRRRETQEECVQVARVQGTCARLRGGGRGAAGTCERQAQNVRVWRGVGSCLLRSRRSNFALVAERPLREVNEEGQGDKQRTSCCFVVDLMKKCRNTNLRPTVRRLRATGVQHASILY